MSRRKRVELQTDFLLPTYGRGPVALYHGEAAEILSRLTEPGIVIFDPPYSAHVHKKSRVGFNTHAGGAEISIAKDLGFAHLSPGDRRMFAAHAARLGRRWSVVFSDVEGAHLWRISLMASGLQYVRTAYWHKIGGTPQFSGDRPSVACELITIAHPKGKKRWNGGGKAGIYSVPIVRAGGDEERSHATQKPEALMLALVEDFSEPGELVYDFAMGSGTTGVAAVRLGRRFVGIERDRAAFDDARKRLDAELSLSTIKAAAMGQAALFGGLS